MAIDRYAARFRVDGVDDFERLMTLIQRMDAEYLAWLAENTKKTPD